MGISIKTTVNFLLAFTFCFPYLPGVFPSDTQPWFLLVFILGLITSTFSRQKRVGGHGLFPSLFLFLCSITLAAAFLSITVNILSGYGVIVGRVIGMLQFFAAFIWAHEFNVKVISEKFLFASVIIYSLFTIIFFASGGAVESFLVSRDVKGEVLLNVGRGARTLSNEPAYFALSIFNIFIYRCLVYSRFRQFKFRDNVFNLLVLLCLFFTYSGFGFAIMVVLMFSLYTWYVIAIGSFFGMIYFEEIVKFVNESSIRSLTLLKEVLDGNTTSLFDEKSIQGQSLSERFGSFHYYIKNFKKSPIIGTGFYELNRNGGLVSYITEVGFSFILILVFTVVRVLTSNLGFKLLVVVLFWISIRMLSGSVAIPGVGIILGLLFRQINKQSDEDSIYRS